ncbi:MAG TPA: DUF748 domain-containing protein [Patescibacteria group bacterium]|nr:DUF748 domain-containing protein [Patescibacteria group bacterium]
MTANPEPPSSEYTPTALPRPEPKPKPLRRRLVLGAVIGAVVIAAVVAGAVLPGVGLRWGVVETLRRLGMVEVTLLDGDLSLFRGRVVVRQMAARPKDGRALALDDLALHFHWRPLLDRRLSFEAVALKGLAIAVEKRDGSYIVNGLPLVVAGAAGAAGAASAPVAKPWTFDIESLQLSDSSLTYDDGQTRLTVDVEKLSVDTLRSWSPDTPTAFHLQGKINGAPVVLDGTATPFATAPGVALRLSLDHFDLAAAAAQSKALGVSQLAGKLTADLTIEGHLDASQMAAKVAGSLALHDLAVADGGNRLAAKSIDWTGNAALGSGTEGEGKLALRGLSAAAGSTSIEAGSLDTDLSRFALDGHSGRITLAGTVGAANATVKAAGQQTTLAGLRLTADDFSLSAPPRRLAWKGGVTVDKGSLSASGLTAAPGALAWTGSVDLSLADPAQPTGKATGKLEVQDAHLTVGDYTIDDKHAAVDGTVELGAAAAVNAALILHSEGLAVAEPRINQDWLAVDHIDLASLKMTPQTGAVLGNLVLGGVSAVQRHGGTGAFPWRVELRDARVDRVGVDPHGSVTAGEVKLSGAVVRLVRMANGFLGFTPAPLPAGTVKPAAAASAQPLPRLSVTRLLIGDQSRVAFDDRTPSDRVQMQIAAIDIAVSNLDTGIPERDSPFSFKAKINDASLSAKGTLRPFADPLSADIKGEVRALELPPLSPYAADALGIHLHTGHFDGDMAVELKRGKLAGKIDLALSNLFIAQPDPGAPISRKADMPIETVLDLLRDSDDRIKLNIPLSGDLKNPDFDISDAVNQAVGGALRSTAATTLEVLFPVAALVSYVVDSDDKRRLSLAPLPFDPGQDGLNDADRKQLSAVVGLMAQRPGLKLSLCGAASPDVDWPVLVEQKRKAEQTAVSKLQGFLGLSHDEPLPPPDRDLLSQLAERRSRQTKGFLTDQAGIDLSRLFECRGKVDEAGAKGGPRVDLLL